MKKQWYKNNMIYALWAIGLLAYILFIANRYCEIYYGGGLLYVITGKNEITAKEQEYLQQRGNLVYADTLDSFPAQLYDESLQGEEGFNMDLMNQLAIEMGTSITFLPIEWPDVFDTLKSGRADFIQISYSDERNEKYFLTEPLYNNKAVVLLRNEGEEIRSLEELEGKKIAGIDKDYAMERLKEKVPNLDIQKYNSLDECAKVLLAGEVDGLLADEQNIMYYVQQENMLQDYYVVAEAVYTAGVVFAVQKSDEELGRIMNKVVYKLRNSGILSRLQQKWFLQSVLEPVISEKEQAIRIFECMLGFVLFFILLFWYIQVGTKALVADRTRELEQERKRLNVILQSIPHQLLEVSSDGGIELVNRELKRSCSKEEKQHFQEQELGFLKELDWKRMLQESGERRYAQKDIQMNSKWYRITVGGIEDKENYDNALMLVEDVTLHHMQEKQNIQNSKMAAIGQLASGVSHELKNPLEIICNYCYALRKGILHTEEQFKNTVEIIEDEAKSANKIVDNLLAFARIAPDKIELTEVRFFVQMILELQKNLMKKRNIQAELNCEEGIYVKCNPEGLKRIFINLINNAQDAMPEGGVIKIVVEKQQDTVCIEIGDTGMGMSENVQEQIFNPFYTTKSTGTGLGLYLVYNQVKESGGTIEVSSMEGKGTTFRLTFPGVEEEKMGDEHE